MPRLVHPFPARVLAVLFATWLATACRTSYQAAAPTVGYAVVDSTYGASAEVDAVIAPYKQELDARMSEVLATSEQLLQKRYPEGLLNHFVADAMLAHGRATLDPTLDFAIINNGGLRSTLPQGNVLLRDVFELMPFDNTMVLLTLAPTEMQLLLQHVAQGAEVTLGGMRMTIEDGKPAEVSIGGQPFDSTRSYRLITINYLAEGGSDMGFMKTRTAHRDTELFMRDFLAAYLRAETREGRPLSAQLDGRLRIIGSTGTH